MSDVLTKALPRAVFETCLVGLGIQRVATGEITAHGTVELDMYGTVEQCTGKSQSCST